MEKKANRYLRWIGISSFIGYFAGTTVYALMGGSDDFIHLMFGLGGALVFALSMSLYTHFKNPSLNVKVNQRLSDERLLMIEGKAAKIALYSVCAVLVLTAVWGIYRGNLWIHYGSIAIFLVITTTYQILRWVINRKK